MPEVGRPSLETRPVHEHEDTLADVVNELRIGKEESRQLRTRMEGVDARQIKALNTEWVHVTAEIAARQNTMAARVGRIEGRKHHSA